MIKTLTSKKTIAFVVAFFTVFCVLTQDIFSQGRQQRQKRGEIKSNSSPKELEGQTNTAKDSMEFGLRAGYFHPLILKHGDASSAASKSPQFGYSVDLYYTLDLSYLSPNLTSDYIPDFHTFLIFGQYFLKSNSESSSQNSLLIGLGIGFLYSFDLFTHQSLKAGLAGGLHYETFSSEGAEPGILLDIYVLLGYEYTFKGINYGIYQRTQFSPDKKTSVLGIGVQLSVGFPLSFF